MSWNVHNNAYNSSLQYFQDVGGLLYNICGVKPYTRTSWRNAAVCEVRAAETIKSTYYVTVGKQTITKEEIKCKLALEILNLSEW